MNAADWSWVTAATSVAGLWISGHNPRWGWVYGLGNQVLWIIYGASTAQPGMVALSIAFIAIYLRNLRRWRGTRFQRAEAPGDGQHEKVGVL